MATEAVVVHGEAVSKNLMQVEELLVDAQEQIAAVLPGHIGADKFIFVALDLVRADSMLATCAPLSVVKSVLEASELGLELNKQLGHGYLVPYKNGEVREAQFQIGYRGLLHLVRQANPNVHNVVATIVYEGEAFAIVQGTERRLEHVPATEHQSLATYVGAYSIVEFKDASKGDFEWMPRAEIEKIKNSSKAKAVGTPWQTWEEEMIKKTVLRRHCKRLALRPSAMAAIVRDEYRAVGVEDTTPVTRIAMPRRKSAAALPAGATVASAPPQPQAVDYSKDPAPICDICSAKSTKAVEMTLVVARPPKNFVPFWSCPNYKKCGAKTKDAAKWHELQAAQADANIGGSAPLAQEEPGAEG